VARRSLKGSQSIQWGQAIGHDSSQLRISVRSLDIISAIALHNTL
jgi:hypothetical protein